MLHLFKPDFFGVRALLGGEPHSNPLLHVRQIHNRLITPATGTTGSPYELSDMFIASVFLGFTICSTMSLRMAPGDRLWFTPVMLMQGLYKAYWCVCRPQEDHGVAAKSPDVMRQVLVLCLQWGLLLRVEYPVLVSPAGFESTS